MTGGSYGESNRDPTLMMRMKWKRAIFLEPLSKYQTSTLIRNIDIEW